MLFKLQCFYSTADHPLSKLLAECQFNVCESIKPLAVATAKGGNFPTLSFLSLTRHRNDPLPSVTVSSSDDHLSSHSYSSAGSTINEHSQSVPETISDSIVQPQLQHLHSTPTTWSNRISIISQNDEEEDFVTSDVFIGAPDASLQGNSAAIHHSTTDNNHKKADSRQSEGEASLNNGHQPQADVESSFNEEAAYFVLETPSKLSNGNGDKSKVSTAYEEIDEATVKRPRSPLPYETPSLFRQDSCDPYYSNICSPESSGYTLLSQWTRSNPEEDYTQLDPSTIISKTSVDGDDDNIYPLQSCSVHLGKREVLEPLSEKVCLSIKEIVREIHLYLGKVTS